MVSKAVQGCKRLTVELLLLKPRARAERELFRQVIATARQQAKAEERRWVVMRTRWRAWVVEPVALVMAKAQAAARDKDLVREAEAMAGNLPPVQPHAVTRLSKVLPVRRKPMPPMPRPRTRTRTRTRLRIQRRLAIATARQQGRAEELRWVVMRTRWRVLVVEPAALVMARVLAAVRDKVLVRKAEAMAENLPLVEAQEGARLSSVPPVRRIPMLRMLRQRTMLRETQPMVIAMARQQARAEERRWVVMRTRWRVLVVEPAALVMEKVLAAARDKVLGRKAEAMAEVMELGMAVVVGS